MWSLCSRFREGPSVDRTIQNEAGSRSSLYTQGRCRQQRRVVGNRNRVVRHKQGGET